MTRPSNKTIWNERVATREAWQELPMPIREFLHFGFELHHKEELPFDSSVLLGSGSDERLNVDRNGNAQPTNSSTHNGKRSDQKSKEYTLKRLREALRSELEPLRDEKKIVLAFSGGTDSRLLLGELLAMGLASRLELVTFGTPGTLDYEIPPDLAKRWKLSHTRINVEEMDYSEEALVSFARTRPSASRLLEIWVNRQIPDRFGPDALYLTGFFGDRLADSQNPYHELHSPEECMEIFFDQEKRDKAGFLAPLNATETEVRLRGMNGLSLWEELFFRLRIMNLDRQNRIFEGFRYKTPLAESAWLRSWFQVPETVRRSRPLYRELAMHASPELFEGPVKSLFGAPMGSPDWRVSFSRKNAYARRILSRRVPWLAVTDPLLNYMDPWWLFNRGKQTRVVAEKQMADLHNRKLLPELNPLDLLKDYRSGRYEAANALMVLFELEIWLKAGHLK